MDDTRPRLAEISLRKLFVGEWELANWHETKRDEREASRQGLYFPRLKAGMDELLGSTSKKYASRYLQLKTGHGAIGTFLARIGVIESPRMLVVRGGRTVCWALVHKVPEVEETKKEAYKELKREKDQLAGLDREESISKTGSRRESMWLCNATWAFSNR